MKETPKPAINIVLFKRIEEEVQETMSDYRRGTGVGDGWRRRGGHGAAIVCIYLV